MQRVLWMWTLGLGMVFLLASTQMAIAVDGVIEINQARALAGGVTASDTPGFPVTIDASGSYRLTSNLEVTATTVKAIDITADNVTLDLNGFAIVGPDSGSGSGVYADARENITVVNGTVRDMGSSGVYLSTRAHVERVRALNNGYYGIATGTGSTTTGNTAYNNADIGILAGAGSTVSGNTAHDNGNDGIHAGAGSTVSGNTVYSNDLDGIDAGAGSTVSGNTARFNIGYGLRLASDAGYANNVLTNNAAGTVLGGILMGTNVCSSDTFCP